MFKKTISLALALVLSLGVFAFPAFAADPISVYLDGRVMTFDVPPQLIHDRTMVPLRAIFEAMGAKVDWEGDTQTVTGTKDNIVVVLKIGDTSPTINGNVVTIDQPGIIIDDRTLAPLRFVAEAFGGTVEWDEKTQTASITMNGAAPIVPATITTAAPVLEGKFIMTALELNGEDMLPFFAMMSGGEFDPNSMFIEFRSDGTFLLEAEDGGTGTYEINGETVTLTAEGEEQEGTFDAIANKFILHSSEDEGNEMRMVFEKQEGAGASNPSHPGR